MQSGLAPSFINPCQVPMPQRRNRLCPARSPLAPSKNPANFSSKRRKEICELSRNRLLGHNTIIVRAGGQLFCSLVCLSKKSFCSYPRRKRGAPCQLQLVMIPLRAMRWGSSVQCTWRDSGIHANQTLDQPKDGTGRGGALLRAKCSMAHCGLGSCALGRDVLSRLTLAGLGRHKLALEII